jgi:hypothetical protein
MAVGMLICPDPNGNCSQSSGADCQMDCDGVACSCPPDAEFSFVAEGPNFDPSPSEIQQMMNTCGGPGTYTSVSPVDSDGNPVNPSDCDQTDSSGKITRVVCYKCSSYPPGWPGFGWGGWAAVGPEGEEVFIG